MTKGCESVAQLRQHRRQRLPAMAVAVLRGCIELGRAAAMLGIHRATLRKKLREYGIG